MSAVGFLKFPWLHSVIDAVFIIRTDEPKPRCLQAWLRAEEVWQHINHDSSVIISGSRCLVFVSSFSALKQTHYCSNPNLLSCAAGCHVRTAWKRVQGHSTEETSCPLVCFVKLVVQTHQDFAFAQLSRDCVCLLLFQKGVGKYSFWGSNYTRNLWLKQKQK